MLTTSELKQLKHYLELYSKKDSQLPPAILPLNVDDKVAILQNGINKLVTISELAQTLEGEVTYDICTMTDYENLSEKVLGKLYICTYDDTHVLPGGVTGKPEDYVKQIYLDNKAFLHEDTKFIYDEEQKKYQKEINQEVQNTLGNLSENIDGLDTRLHTVEELGQIMVEGGEIGIATAFDFKNPTPEQKAKVPTVGAMLEGYVTVSQNTLTVGSEEVGELAGQLVENPEWVKVVTDSKDKILYGVKTDGKFYFGDSCPPQIQEYIQNIIDGLSLDEYEDIVAFLSDYLGSDTTLKVMIDGINATKVDKIEGKSLIDAGYADGVSQIENSEFVEVHTDTDDKILYGVKQDGDFYFGAGVPQQIQDELDNKANLADLATKVDKEEGKSLIDADYASSQSAVNNPEYLQVTIDSKGKILEGINNNGEKVFGKIPPQIKELIGCGKLIIAASNSKYKQFANVICTGEHDQDVINECINNPDVKSIYFLDGTYLIDAPILPKSGLYIEAHNDSLFTTIDMVEATLTEEVSTGNILKLNNVADFHPGMLLYIADDSGDFNSSKSWDKPPKIISINTSNNTIIVSGNVPHTFPIGTSVKSASPCFFIDHVSNVTINCVNIDWNVANNPIQRYNPWYLQEGIQIAFSEYVIIKNCKINNGGRRGICTINSKYFQILNNYFNNWHEHSIDIFWENYIPYDGYDNLNPPMTFGVISGNICLNNQMSGIQCHRGSGCTITGNTIKNCPHGGIRNQEYAHHNAIVGNVIEGCGNGLLLGGHDITANGNVIKDCSSGAQIGDFSERVIVDGNSIQNSQHCAINFHSARFCRVSNNIITNSCLAITASSSSDTDVSVVSITERHGAAYDGESHHNQVIGNTFIEESRELLPRYIFKNPEENTANVVVRNLCIIGGTIETPFGYTTSDVVKDNDIIINL